MTRSRGPELSKEFKDYIFNQWMFYGRNAYEIADIINNDTQLLSKFGKTSHEGVYYHIKNIEADLENTISEDAMDTYIGEFIRARTGFEKDVQDVRQLIDHEMSKGMDNADKELVLKLRRFVHEIKLDSFKMLQDSALPLQVKKLKLERQKYRPKNMGVLEVKEDGESDSNSTNV